MIVDETESLTERFRARDIRGPEAQYLAFVLMNGKLHLTSTVLKIISQERQDIELRSLLADRLAHLVALLEPNDLTKVLNAMSNCYLAIRNQISDRDPKDDEIEAIIGSVSAAIYLEEQNPCDNLIILSEVIAAAINTDDSLGNILEDAEDLLPIMSTGNLRVLTPAFMEFVSLHAGSISTILSLLSNGMNRIADLETRINVPASISAGSL